MVGATALPTCSGLLLGLCLSRLLRLEKMSCVAVGIESSLQNGVLALAIVQITLDSLTKSVPGEDGKERVVVEGYGQALLVPVVYSFISCWFNIIVGLLLWKVQMP